MLKPYNLTCWQLTPVHDTDVLSWISIFNLLVNENDFRYQSNATDSWNRVILHFMRHFSDMINTIINVGTRDHDDHLKWQRHHWQKDHLWLKSYHVTSVANIVVNPLIFDMSMLHDKSSWYSQSNLKEKICSAILIRNFKIHFHWDRD